MIPRDQTSADEKDRTRRLQRTASGLLYAVLVAVAIWMIRDFIPAVVWAAVIAIALWPLLTWLEQRPVFKERRTWLAVVLTVVLGLVFVVPFILVARRRATKPATCCAGSTNR
jgi:predicted PurR-regulated permease PerM